MRFAVFAFLFVLTQLVSSQSSHADPAFESLVSKYSKVQIRFHKPFQEFLVQVSQQDFMLYHHRDLRVAIHQARTQDPLQQTPDPELTLHPELLSRLEIELKRRFALSLEKVELTPESQKKFFIQ
jgi:hypothetical protein